MIPAIEKARNHFGHATKVVALECNVSCQTVDNWRSGRRRCPIKKRASVDRGFGIGVNWEEYDKEFDAIETPVMDQSPNWEPESTIPQQTDNDDPFTWKFE